MRKTDKKPALLVLLTLAAIVAANILMSVVWFSAGYAQAEIKSGPEGTASAVTAGSQSQVVAANDDRANFVTVWTGGYADGDLNGISFRTFNRAGEPITDGDKTANMTESGNQEYPSVAMTSDGKFVVAWSGNGPGDETGIFIRAFELDGTPISNEFRVNSVTEGTQYRPVVSLDRDNTGADGKVAVTWTVNDGSQEDIRAQLVDIDFSGSAPVTPVRVGNELLVNDYTAGYQGNPSVAMGAYGDFIVAWDGEGESSAAEVRYQAYDRAGTRLGPNTALSSSSVTGTKRPRIAADLMPRDSSAGTYTVAFEGSSSDDQSGIFIRQITCSPSACKIGPSEIMANTTTEGNLSLPAAAADYLGNFTVAWVENISGSINIKAQSFNYNGGSPLGQIARSGTEFRVNGTPPSAAERPSVAMNADGQYVITYVSDSNGDQDVKYQAYVSNLFKAGTETLVHPADASALQAMPDIAYAPDGHHAAVWVDYSPVRSIRFTLWDGSNSVIAENIRVDGDDPSNVDANPRISFFRDTGGPDRGRFVIVWEGVAPPCAGDAQSTDIFYRQIDAAGNVLGACETRVNGTPAGTQRFADVAAGYYNNDGDAPEDRFAVIYSDENSVTGAYHDGSSFTYSELASGGQAGAVAMDPVSTHVIYSWNDFSQGTGKVYARQAIGGQSAGPAFTVNPSGDSMDIFPDAAFLVNDQFLVSWTKTNADLGFGEIWAERYTFNESGNPVTIDGAFRIDGGAGAGEGGSWAGRIAADSEGEDILLAWSNMPDTRYNVYARFLDNQGPGTGALAPFGPVFRVNSSLDRAGIAAVGMDGNGLAAVAYEGDISSPGNIDPAGIAVQNFYSPLHPVLYPELQPSAEQIITGGGRSLVVPDSITFPPSTVNTTNQTSVQTSIRDEQSGGAPVKYLEVTDLDGASFTVSAAITEDFLLTPPGTTSYIPAALSFIRNWDQNTADTDAGCSPVSPLLCVQTLNSSATTTSFQLDASSDGFIPLDAQQTLINKTSEHEIGKWRFFPEFKLDIPPRTPPGSHTTTIYFSLI